MKMPLPPHTATTRSNGFTLIELMVTLAVVALLVVLGAPSLTRFMLDRSVAVTTDTFVSDLRFARSEALKRGQTVSVCIASNPDATTRSCATAAGTAGYAAGWLVFVDLNGDGALGNTDTVLRVQQDLTNRINGATSNNAATTKAFTFMNNGLSAASQSGVTFTPHTSDTTTSSALQRMVCVARTGRARITSAGATSC